jgi:hypothetical protein
MALDEARQALLDVFCHCYGLLLAHLDHLEGAVCAHRGWNCYRLMRECVDKAAYHLGSTLPERTDYRVLCADFLRRIRGEMDACLPGESPAFDVIDACGEAVHIAPIDSPVDLGDWQHIGEELSRDCYCRHLPSDAPALGLLVERVDLIPSNISKPSALPEKAQSRGGITFGFAANRFTFADYVNLPFFFFHEYLSHLHSAPMFAEHCGRQDHPFTEGWMLWYARLAYSHALFAEPHPALYHPLHRDHYVACYLQSELDERSRPMIYKGYEFARQFAKLVGEPRFERVTLLIASTPYDVFTPLAPDLHGEFVRRVQDWLRRVATLSSQEREDRFTTLDALLDTPGPMRRLMEWLI